MIRPEPPLRALLQAVVEAALEQPHPTRALQQALTALVERTERTAARECAATQRGGDTNSSMSSPGLNSFLGTWNTFGGAA